MEENNNEQLDLIEEVKEEVKEEETQEGIRISNDVIAVIAGIAASEVRGVAAMAGGITEGLTEALKGKKNKAKGIKVDATETTAKIDVNIIVEYGTRIPDIAFEIQNRVKKSVESMTGLKVEEVNVNVQGVNTDSLASDSQNDETENKQENENQNEQ